MIQLNFHKPLTALEIRDPAVEACRVVAKQFDLHVTFHQPQQPALSGHPHEPASARTRIGNGKHKNWLVEFQEDEPSVNNPKVVGRIALLGPLRPEAMQYGGFDYGNVDESSPTYSYVRVYTTSELDYYRPIDPSPDVLKMTYQALKEQFEGDTPRLFDVDLYTI